MRLRSGIETEKRAEKNCVIADDVKNYVMLSTANFRTIPKPIPSLHNFLIKKLLLDGVWENVCLLFLLPKIYELAEIIYFQKRTEEMFSSSLITCRRALHPKIIDFMVMTFSLADKKTK